MNEKPRWAFVHPFQLRLRRGIETWLWNLSTALADAGLDVDIITWQGPLSIPSDVKRAGVQVRRVPAFPYYQRSLTVPLYVGLFASRRYDHIFVNFAGHGEGPALWGAQKIRRTPFSVVFHFPRTQVPHRYEEFRRWGYCRKADHLIAVSRFVAGQVQEWSGRACSVIGHGVDIQRFRTSAQRRREVRQRLDIATDANILITVAALEKRKGVQWGIKALSLVQDKYPQTHYLVLGDGPYRQELEKLAQDLNLQERVHFLGWVEDVPEYLSAGDIALLLSYGEASPIALLEYAASALPILTSRHPPFEELVQPDWGLMVDERNTAEVAQTIITLIQDNQKRTAMGAAARAWMKVNHSWQQVAQKYRALIG